ncbi:MAG: hypothetical protein EOO32_02790 [Comamonadaceae bacterium]|nr:MAG: hypothetical protein EOO32_02790 [Comamonadaceae bacterium]
MTNDNGRSRAMSNAERQRKHRAKRDAELQALRAVVPSSQNEHDLAAQVKRLALQLEKSTKAAAEQQGRIDALLAEQGAVQLMRDAWHALLPKLSPASQHLARTHMRASAAARWFELPAPPPPRQADPGHYHPPPNF